MEAAWDLVARAAKRTGLSRVRLEETLVYKRRRTGGEALARLENAVLSALGEPVRIVSGASWLAREDAAWSGRARLEHGDLVVPRAPGESLTDRLAFLGNPPALAARSFEAALVSLGALHARGLTHGDATTDNVVVAEDGESAVWIDFEQEHLGDARRARDDDHATLVLGACTRVRGPVRSALFRVMERSAHAEALTATRDFLARHPSLPFLMRARLDGRSGDYREVRAHLLAPAEPTAEPSSVER